MLYLKTTKFLLRTIIIAIGIFSGQNCYTRDSLDDDLKYTMIGTLASLGIFSAIYYGINKVEEKLINRLLYYSLQQLKQNKKVSDEIEQRFSEEYYTRTDDKYFVELFMDNQEEYHNVQALINRDACNLIKISDNTRNDIASWQGYDIAKAFRDEAQIFLVKNDTRVTIACHRQGSLDAKELLLNLASSIKTFNAKHVRDTTAK